MKNKKLNERVFVTVYLFVFGFFPVIIWPLMSVMGYHKLGSAIFIGILAIALAMFVATILVPIASNESTRSWWLR